VVAVGITEASTTRKPGDASDLQPLIDHRYRVLDHLAGPNRAMEDERKNHARWPDSGECQLICPEQERPFNGRSTRPGHPARQSHHVWPRQRTRDVSKAHRLANGLRSGSVWINCSISTRRWRALGREMGEEVFHNYIEIKAVTAAL
jgi:hypothetical protein